MTTIATMSPVVSQPSLAVQASTGAAAAPSIPLAAPPSPAVVISISPGTQSAVSHPSDKTAEQRVSSLVEAVKTHNDIADAVAQMDWKKFAEIAGPERAEAEKMASMKYLSYSATRLGREFGESRIDVRAVTDEQAAVTGQAPGTLKVASFAFKSGGSSYAVTAKEDGTLVGTRDGEAWKTWKTIPSHAARAASDAGAALATL
ncbi:hypothetical protein EAH89_15800 [Roseomonas nepalensis]|uniref:Uncharacterized protein n=1 Tax=Muricoccus nepalensis TaxID=1854500 RepID=A0A502FVK6_9PROT|nr:hypothetical protein [Roseomonas nepalensis]TPG53667.1 hypothetical protein EAH89_15800 [Roseomonas nepalensis]